MMKRGLLDVRWGGVGAVCSVMVLALSVGACSKKKDAVAQAMDNLPKSQSAAEQYVAKQEADSQSADYYATGNQDRKKVEDSMLDDVNATNKDAKSNEEAVRQRAMQANDDETTRLKNNQPLQ